MGITPDRLRQILDAYVTALRQHISVDQVILFGSYARNSADEDSDIDVAVVSPDFGRDILHDLQLLAGLRKHADFRIQALAYTPEQVEQCQTGTFLHEILQTGKTIYSKRSAVG